MATVMPSISDGLTVTVKFAATLANAAQARAAALHVQSWSVSISHDRTQAIAFVVGV